MRLFADQPNLLLVFSEKSLIAPVFVDMRSLRTKKGAMQMLVQFFKKLLARLVGFFLDK